MSLTQNSRKTRARESVGSPKGGSKKMLKSMINWPSSKQRRVHVAYSETIRESHPVLVLSVIARFNEWLETHKGIFWFRAQ